jgi:hypothetical protein
LATQECFVRLQLVQRTWAWIPAGARRELDKSRFDLRQCESLGVVVPPAIELSLLLGPVVRGRVELCTGQQRQVAGSLDPQFTDDALHHSPWDKQGGGDDQHDGQAEQQPALCRQGKMEHPWFGHRRLL